MARSPSDVLCSVSLCAPLQIDISSFELWLQGLSVREIAVQLSNENKYSHYKAYLAQIYKNEQDINIETEKMVIQSVANQVRNFPFLCHFLASAELTSQTAFDLPYEDCVSLAGVYFQIDKKIARELLGSKFKNLNKMRLDSIVEKLKTPTQTVKRSYDNVRATYLLATKENEKCILYQLQAQLLLPYELAIEYMCIVFLCIQKFETSKKKLLNLTYKHFMQMSAILACNWCTTSAEPKLDSLITLQTNKKFLDSLRPLKNSFTRELTENYKIAILSEFVAISAEKVSKVEKELTVFLKHVITLASSLHGKEGRDYFVILHDKILVSLRERMEITIKEVRGLLRVMIACFAPLQLPIDVKEACSDHWTIFITTLGECVRIIYQV